ncbi:MAG: hypothetical protein ACKO2P_21285 [Planctomycetota bacterium]
MSEAQLAVFIEQRERMGAVDLDRNLEWFKPTDTFANSGPEQGQFKIPRIWGVASLSFVHEKSTNACDLRCNFPAFAAAERWNPSEDDFRHILNPAIGCLCVTDAPVENSTFDEMWYVIGIELVEEDLRILGGISLIRQIVHFTTDNILHLLDDNALPLLSQDFPVLAECDGRRDLPDGDQFFGRSPLTPDPSPLEGRGGIGVFVLLRKARAVT